MKLLAMTLHSLWNSIGIAVIGTRQHHSRVRRALLAQLEMQREDVLAYSGSLLGAWTKNSRSRRAG